MIVKSFWSLIWLDLYFSFIIQIYNLIFLFLFINRRLNILWGFCEKIFLKCLVYSQCIINGSSYFVDGGGDSSGVYDGDIFFKFFVFIYYIQYYDIGFSIV